MNEEWIVAFCERYEKRGRPFCSGFNYDVRWEDRGGEVVFELWPDIGEGLYWCIGYERGEYPRTRRHWAEGSSVNMRPA